MGASYVRDEPLPESVEVLQSQSMTIDVPFIYDEHTLGKVPLKLNLRQTASSSTLSFVTFTETANLSVINIDTTGVAPGDYELKFESYDSESTI